MSNQHSIWLILWLYIAFSGMDFGENWFVGIGWRSRCRSIQCNYFAKKVEYNWTRYCCCSHQGSFTFQKLCLSEKNDVHGATGYLCR